MLARRRRDLVEALLAGPDRDLEPVLGWRQRAAPVVVVRAVRVVRAIEVEQVLASAERLRLYIAARAVGLLTASRVAEGDEELVALVEREQSGVSAIDGEFERPGALQ